MLPDAVYVNSIDGRFARREGWVGRQTPLFPTNTEENNLTPVRPSLKPWNAPHKRSQYDNSQRGSGLNLPLITNYSCVVWYPLTGKDSFNSMAVVLVILLFLKLIEWSHLDLNDLLNFAWSRTYLSSAQIMTVQPTRQPHVVARTHIPSTEQYSSPASPRSLSFRLPDPVCPRVTLIMTSDPVDYSCFFLEMEFSSWYSSVPGLFCLELCKIRLYEITSRFSQP